MDCSFDKESRLLNSIDFNYLRENSKSCGNKLFRLYYKNSRKDLNKARLGLSVSKKAGKAHRRNLIKRIIRENFRTHHLRELPVDVIVIASFHLKNDLIQKDEIDKHIKDCFDRLCKRELKHC